MLGFGSKKGSREVYLNVTNKTIVRVIVVVFIILVVIAFLRAASHEILLIFLSFLLAIALNNPVRKLAKHLPGKRQSSRLLATTISYLIVIAILAGILALLVPPLVHQTNHFIHSLPQLVSNAQDKGTAFGHFISQYHLEGQLQTFTQHINDYFNHAAGSIFSTVVQIGESVISVIIVLVLTFMMLLEAPFWKQQTLRLVPHEHRSHVNRVGCDMAHVIRGYVNGQVLLAAIAAALITPMLFILGISYPLALMAVVFLAALVPVIGHTIGAIIVTIVALFHSPLSAIIILAYYILYINIENYVIQPRIQSNTTNLSPLLVIISIVLGVAVGGIFGGLIAIPVAGSIRVLVVDYLREQDKLAPEDDATTPPATPDSTK